MPLLDHFRPPLSERRHWHSFHNSWATYISSQLNALLPQGYFAEANVQFGVEIDVAAFEELGTETETANWQPPPPHAILPIEFSEAIVEIAVFSQSGGPQLIAAMELISPANKDRLTHREAFVNKCASYLQAGISVVLVDVVTERSADLHSELLLRLGAGRVAASSALFASAYRPVERDSQTQLEVWHEPLQIGESLPTLPLWLRGGFCLPVDLEASYERTTREQRILGDHLIK